MQLRQAETLGMLDHHDRRGGNVDADLDDRGGNQNVDALAGERSHHRILLGRLQAPMDQPDAIAKPLSQRLVPVRRRREVDVLRLLDQWTDPVNLGPLAQLAGDGRHHIFDTVGRHRSGIDRLAARRLVDQARHIHVAIGGQGQGARDRGGGHHQHIDRAAALGRELQPLMHAEPVLFVDHRQSKIMEPDVVLDQRVGADDDRQRAGGQFVQQAGPPLALVAAGQQPDTNARRIRQRRDGLHMLSRQDLGGRQDRGLRPGLDRGQHRRQGDHGLAAADIALQQPQHAVFGRHVGRDLGDRLALRAGQGKGKGGFDLGGEPPVAAQRPAGQAAQRGAYQCQRQLIGQ